MILFLIIGALGAVYFVNYLKGRPGLKMDVPVTGIEDSREDSLEILQKRFASGEISQNEYIEINDIKGNPWVI